MGAKEQFRKARSLFRLGLRSPEKVADNRLTRSGRNPNGLAKWRPACNEGTAIAHGLDPWCVQFLGRYSPPPPIISTTRHQWQSGNRICGVASARQNRGCSWFWAYPGGRPNLPKDPKPEVQQAKETVRLHPLFAGMFEQMGIAA